MLEMYKCLDCGHYFIEPDEIEHIEDVMTIIRTKHMCRTWDDDITKEEIEIYKNRFQALKMAVELLKEETE